MRKIHEFEEKHGLILSMAIQTCKLHASWSINEQHPGMVSRVHLKTRLMDINFGLKGGKVVFKQ